MLTDLMSLLSLAFAASKSPSLTSSILAVFRFSKFFCVALNVASIFLMHVVINIGMTMGLLPVIGIPLPFLSYGGSGMVSFTILLFIFIRLDMERQNKDA